VKSLLFSFFNNLFIHNLVLLFIGSNLFPDVAVGGHGVADLLPDQIDPDLFVKCHPDSPVMI
jgi:hypothetical protein